MKTKNTNPAIFTRNEYFRMRAVLMNQKCATKFITKFEKSMINGLIQKINWINSGFDLDVGVVSMHAVFTNSEVKWLLKYINNEIMYSMDVLYDGTHSTSSKNSIIEYINNLQNLTSSILEKSI